MSSVSVQFHAIPSEFGNLISDLTDDRDVFVTAAIGDPLDFISQPSLEGHENFEKFRALMFTMGKPRLDVRDLYEFRKINPDALVLELGKLTDKGLEESWLSAKTDNKLALRRWRRASKELIREMFSGAEAINNSNGCISPMRWHRFTEGALKAYKDGKKILPTAGNATIKLPTIF